MGTGRRARLAARRRCRLVWQAGSLHPRPARSTPRTSGYAAPASAGRLIVDMDGAASSVLSLRLLPLVDEAGSIRSCSHPGTRGSTVARAQPRVFPGRVVSVSVRGGPKDALPGNPAQEAGGGEGHRSGSRRCSRLSSPVQGRRPSRSRTTGSPRPSPRSRLSCVLASPTTSQTIRPTSRCSVASIRTRPTVICRTTSSRWSK